VNDTMLVLPPSTELPVESAITGQGPADCVDESYDGYAEQSFGSGSMVVLPTVQVMHARLSANVRLKQVCRGISLRLR